MHGKWSTRSIEFDSAAIDGAGVEAGLLLACGLCLLTTASKERDDVTSKRGHETLEGEIWSWLRDSGSW